MEKVVYVLWGGTTAAASAPALVEAGALDLVVYDIDPDGDARYRGPGPIDARLGPFAGVVAFWLDCIDDLASLDALVRARGPAHGYLVTESVPIRSRDVVLGAPTPGCTLLTVFDRLEHVSEEVFLRNWTTGHTPRVRRWAPLTGYVRNHVVRPVTAGAPRLAAVVCEQVAVLEDMVDPARFVGAGGDPELARRRNAEMAENLASFLDFSRLEAHCAIERRFGSAARPSSGITRP